MATLRLDIVYSLNTGAIISPTELRENYLFGVPLCSVDGTRMPSSSLLQHIMGAQTLVENMLSLKLLKTVIEENRDFNLQEFMSWGYIRTMYPVDYIDNLEGWINGLCQITYPREWLSIKKQEDIAVFRNVYLIPNTGSRNGATMTNNSMIYNGISPHLGWFGQSFIPNYWRPRYVTGWDRVPADLLELVAKLASINILAILGDVLYGIGITSLSVSLDGVSQSTPLARSGNGGLFGGRIKSYIDDINDRLLPTLKSKYRGISFEVL